MNRLAPYFQGYYPSVEEARKHAQEVLLFCMAIRRIHSESGREFAEGVPEMEAWAADMVLRLGPSCQ
jgi:hypothetical protein